MPDHYDFLILGGGTAGCVLAARLSEDPDHSVCLIEAGPDYGVFDEGRWPAELVDPRSTAEGHDWEPEGQPSLSRARVIGGCSAHNAAFVAWGHPEDYEGWAPDWSFDTLRPHLLAAERAIATRALEEDELGPWARAIVRGAAAAGVPLLDDFNEPSDGVAFLSVNVKSFARWNTAFAYLDAARGRANLTVLDRALVDRVVFEADRAVGAIAVREGRRSPLAADRVVLSTGAYGSPLILMRSGVGPAGHLTALDIEVVAPLEGVGVNLQDHFGINMVFSPTTELQRALAEQEGGGRMIGSGSIVKGRSGGCPSGTWDLHLVSWSARDTEGITGTDWRVQLSPYVMKPHSRGRLRLRDSAPDSAPDVELGYLSDADGRDLAALADGIGLVRRIASAGPIIELIEGEAVPGPEVRETEAFARENVRGYFHPVGTCRIGGRDDPGAVVDAEGRVRGLENLYVCDASIIPTIPRANTNLTTIAIAEKIADQLRRGVAR